MRRLITGLLIGSAVSFVALSVFAIWWFYSGGKILSVATGSMIPQIHPGDAVIVHKIYSDSVQVGNVISYRSSGDVVVPITHRVTEVLQDGTFTTQGDALATPDTAPVHKTQVIGRVTAVAPHLGMVMGWMRKPYVLSAFIYTPVAAIAIIELRRLQFVWHLPTYSLRHRQRVQ